MKILQIMQEKWNSVRFLNQTLLSAKEETGSTIVEFAFAGIILVGVTFGMIDFSSILYARNAVQSAAQEGAREAIMLDDDGSLRYNDIREAVKDKLILLDPSKADISIDMLDEETVEVEVQYPVEFITPVGGVVGLLSSGNGEWAKGWTIDTVARMVIH